MPAKLLAIEVLCLFVCHSWQDIFKNAEPHFLLTARLP